MLGAIVPAERLDLHGVVLTLIGQAVEHRPIEIVVIGFKEHRDVVVRVRPMIAACASAEKARATPTPKPCAAAAIHSRSASARGRAVVRMASSGGWEPGIIRNRPLVLATIL